MAPLSSWSAWIVTTCLFFPLLATTTHAQQAPNNQSHDSTAVAALASPKKQIHIIDARGHSPRVDGKLDDQIWKDATFTSDFLEKEPVQGAQPQERTEVAVAYDETSIYVAARMYSAHPEKLRMHLDKHDQQGPAEQFIVTFDTYFDHRTAYGFGVNTAGVRFDRYNATDNEGDRDYSYDPVWAAKTSRDAQSWIAEIEIPLSQLRFRNQQELTWGINFDRWVPSRNEDIYWIYVPRDGTGWASRFGELTGIKGIQPSRRLEMIPYGASDASSVGGNFKGNPFTDGKNLNGRIGGDIKMGLGPNLTLNGTINPDFGQVEADPAVVNLSAFETFFDEKRPFFTEGSQLLDNPRSGYFYSRRIGAAPHSYGTGDYVDQPSNSAILGAAKITGQLQNGTTIGFLSALTQREYAKNFDTASGTNYKTEVEPATVYTVARMQKPFGANQSTVAFTLAGTARDIRPGTLPESQLRKNALTGGVDWTLRMKGGEYEFNGIVGFSHVTGSKHAILRTQMSPLRYYQRPDAHWLQLDSNRTSLNGVRQFVELTKKGGKHWIWVGSFSTKSPGLELDDAGQQGGADDIDGRGQIYYRETTPGKIFRYYDIGFSGNSNWNRGGNREFADVGVFADFTMKNFWTPYVAIHHQINGQDDSRTRGGPSMQNESGFSFDLGFNNNFTKTLRYSLSTSYGIDQLKGYAKNINGSISTRIGNRWTVELDPSLSWEDQPRQYVSTLPSDSSGQFTYGNRYVFSRIEKTTYSVEIRTNYYFTPDLSLEVYAQPFVASGHYYDHGELTAARGHTLEYYRNIQTKQDDQGNRYYEVTNKGETFTLPFLDYGDRSFRSNVVLRWEFHPGSTMYFVWQRNLAASRDIGVRVGPGALFDSFGATGQDFLALKIAYWIPVS